MLHSVPLGDGEGRVRGDVDHLLVGPCGVVSINTKHHRTGKLVCDGDELVLNGYRTDYVPKARRETRRVTGFLQAVLRAAAAADLGSDSHAADLEVVDLAELAGLVPVRSVVVIVGGRVTVARWPTGVTVVMSGSLIEALSAFPTVLTAEQVAAVYALARRDTTWNPPARGRR